MSPIILWSIISLIFVFLSVAILAYFPRNNATKVRSSSLLLLGLGFLVALILAGIIGFWIMVDQGGSAQATDTSQVTASTTATETAATAADVNATVTAQANAEVAIAAETAASIQTVRAATAQAEATAVKQTIDAMSSDSLSARSATATAAAVQAAATSAAATANAMANATPLPISTPLPPFPTDTPPSTPTPMATRTSTPIPGTKTPVEITQNIEPLESNQLGEVDIEYPIRMSPRSSDSIRVLIYIPQQLASLEPIAIERIEIPPDSPRIIGQLTSYSTIIFISNMMQVELSSPTFQIESLYPSKQKVDLENVIKPTIWAWNIVAPDTVGAHILTVRVFQNDDDTPTWVGNIRVEVTELERPLPLIPLIGIVLLAIIVLSLVAYLGFSGRLFVGPLNRKLYLQRQIINWSRRLQGLQEQKALLGVSADPHLDIEIEDIQQRIRELQAEIESIEMSTQR